ncbi:hypothetical protein COO60DRAFT_1628330 [Scenedesmus sp. NREL 46B-D3]|nr:hypothetical protein COO60DRAFT_1628330 [Scenedesmus sp. NREL 46B-D3]
MAAATGGSQDGWTADDDLDFAGDASDGDDVDWGQRHAQAIDEQVDLIAASAAKALGSFWGGLNTVAKQSLTVGAALTAKVEAAAKEVAKELAVGLEEGVQAVGGTDGAAAAAAGAPAAGGLFSLREAAGQLAARAERSLESAGRGAASLLDPQCSRELGGSSGRQAMARAPSDWAATFDSCFELYGGAQAAEELEQLSSECAHICNRARATLQQEARLQQPQVAQAEDTAAASSGVTTAAAASRTQQLVGSLALAASLVLGSAAFNQPAAFAAVRLLVLAAVCREHILLVGPPGTAKSEVRRRLSQLILGAYFERLLTRFSVPEELFGPLSMRALEGDEYVRQTRGYLPDAQVPLVTLVGASNELPEDEELDALYDRFLLRKEVKPVSAAALTQMLDYYAGNSYDDGVSVTPQQGRTQHNHPGKQRPAHVITLLADLRSYLQEQLEPPVLCLTGGWSRRWRSCRWAPCGIWVVFEFAPARPQAQHQPEGCSGRQAGRQAQHWSGAWLAKVEAHAGGPQSGRWVMVAAYCNGRSAVTKFDCLLLEHVLWQSPQHAPRIAEWLRSQLAVSDDLQQVTHLLKALSGRARRSISWVRGPVEKIQEECTQLRSLLEAQLEQLDKNLEGGFPEVLDNLWLGREEATAVAAELDLKLKKTRSAVEQLLLEVQALEVQAASPMVAPQARLARHQEVFCMDRVEIG